MIHRWLLKAGLVLLMAGCGAGPSGGDHLGFNGSAGTALTLDPLDTTLESRDPSASSGATHRWFKIVLAAGPGDDPASLSQTGCSRDHAGNCDLYKIQYEVTGSGHNDGHANHVDRLTSHADGLAAYFPTVSPDGTVVAYNLHTVGTKISHIYQVGMWPGAAPVQLKTWGRFPSYYQDSFGAWGMIYAAHTDRTLDRLSLGSGLPPLPPGSWSRSTVIPAAANTDVSYSDPHVDPLNSNRLVYEYKDANGGSDSPLIFSYVRNLTTQVDQILDQATIGTDNVAHCSWNGSASEIACGAMGGEQYGFHFKPKAASWTSSSATPSNTLFEAFDASQMVAQVTGGGLPGNSYGQINSSDPVWNGFRVRHSYVEFCQSNDWITVSVQAQRLDTNDANPNDTKNKYETEYSRVYLVNITDRNNPVYYDLTLAIETAREAGAYRWESVSATCTALDT